MLASAGAQVWIKHFKTFHNVVGRYKQWHHHAMDKDEIDARTIAFANDLIGPLGPKPLEKVLRQHLELFTVLRETGASWRQIAALMTHHGVKRKNGEFIDATQWAAMISRATNTVAKPPSASVSADIKPPGTDDRSVEASLRVADSPPAPSNVKTDRDIARARMRKATDARRD